MTQNRGSFTRVGFILAAAGSAIGLGNIWKFPYMTFENNGGSFVLIYLITVLLVGFPIMLAEVIIGRSTQKSPVGAFLKLGNPIWSLVGWLGIGTGFVILSYYSVVSGWTIYYFIKCIGWSLHGLPPDQVAQVGAGFGDFLGDGPKQILFHGLFSLACIAVVVFGVKSGIERIARILMPILFGILLVLFINSFFAPGFKEAMSFIFKPSSINPDSVLEAVGHAFFTLSLGMGAIITYGSYMTRKESIPRAAASVCIMDTMIALVACVVMFSIIFSIPEADREGQFSRSVVIMFTTLPRMFYSMPGGAFLSPMFYLLICFAALTSAISLLEVVVSYFIDQLNWPRVRATILTGLTIFAFGILSALSLGSSETLSSWNPFDGKSQGVFDTMDYLASNWFLPVGGIFIAIFVGWILKKSMVKNELEEGHGSLHDGIFATWRFLLRFVAPVAIGWIIYSVIFLGKTFN